MNNWINKTFFKSKCVKAVVYCEDKRVRTYYVLPDDNKNTITIKELGKSFWITTEDGKSRFQYIDINGFPTYLYHYDRIEPVDPMDAKNLGSRKPAEVNKALSAKILQELFSSINSSLSGNMMFFLMMGLMVLGFGMIYYVFSQQLDELKQIITSTTEFVEVISWKH